MNNRTPAARPGPSPGDPAFPRATVLLDHGAPPLLGYALACSVAWHARAPVVLLAAEVTHPPELKTTWDRLRSVQPGKNRAYLHLFGGETDEASVTLPEMLAHLGREHAIVLVQMRAGTPAPVDGPTVQLAGSLERARSTARYVICCPSSGPLLRPNRNRELHVPALGREDESGLLRGLLPPSTPMGRALGWAGRDIAGLKVGLALGAGSALGYTHIGVLRALGALGVPVDYLAGASIGSCVAALFSAGYDYDVMAQVLDEVGPATWRPTLPRSGLLSVKPLRRHLQFRGGDRRIEDLPIPLAIIAADIASQREIVFRRGPVWPALLASIAIPGIYPPQRMGDLVLVDGGVVNPVPADVAAGMGADVVIAVKLLARPQGGREEVESAEPRGPTPAMLPTVIRSIEIMQSRITAAAAAAAAVQIPIDFAGQEDPGLRHFSQGHRFIPRGEDAVQDALPGLTRVLPWITPHTDKA